MSKRLTPEVAAVAVAKLALMAYFPGDPEVRAALVPIFMSMVETDEQMEWLADRALRLFSRWPGVAEIRALYCSRYKPKDGLEGYSETFDSFPSEQPAPLPPGRQHTADRELDDEIVKLGKLKRFPGRADKPEAK